MICGKYTYFFKAQLCSFKALTGAGEHYEELKAMCGKFQSFLCKASVTEGQFIQKKRQMKINDMFTNKNKQDLCNVYTFY